MDILKNHSYEGNVRELLNCLEYLGSLGRQEIVAEDLPPYMKEELTFYKGCDKDREQYSGFDGTNKAGQSLGEILEMMDIKDVYVCGIATEFCVKETCLDLQKAGFPVHLISRALGYVDHENHLRTLRELEASGIRIVHK